jgi:effector-binding domain-containing protein
MAERRDFYRLSKRIEVEYKVIIDKFASTGIAPDTSFTDSISGNGLTLLTSKKLDKGTKLEMTLKIENGDIDMAGEVIGNKELSRGQFETIVKFFQVDEPERQRLIKYITREGVKSKPKKK